MTTKYQYDQNILELVGLILAPLVIVEIFKLLKINSLSDEK